VKRSGDSLIKSMRFPPFKVGSASSQEVPILTRLHFDAEAFGAAAPVVRGGVVARPLGDALIAIERVCSFPTFPAWTRIWPTLINGDRSTWNTLRSMFVWTL
jgi:hypothetical protein